MPILDERERERSRGSPVGADVQDTQLSSTATMEASHYTLAIRQRVYRSECRNWDYKTPMNATPGRCDVNFASRYEGRSTPKRNPPINTVYSCTYIQYNTVFPRAMTILEGPSPRARTAPPHGPLIRTNETKRWYLPLRLFHTVGVSLAGRTGQLQYDAAAL